MIKNPVYYDPWNACHLILMGLFAAMLTDLALRALIA